MFYIHKLFRVSRYLAPILALSLLLSLNCGDDEVDVQSTTTPHNFRKPDALTIASDPEDGEKEFLFIANSTKGTISIVDLTDNSLVDADADSSNKTNPISVNGITPAPDSRIIRDLALNPDGTLLLAAWVGPTTGFLSAIDIRGVFTGSGAGPQTTIALSGQPHSIAVSSGTVYITCSKPESIVGVICEGNTVSCQEKEILPLANSPRNITISEDSRFAYVTFFDSSEIATVNIAGTMTLAAPLLSVSAVTISGTPIDLAIDPDADEAYLTIASPTPYQLAVVDIISPTQGQFSGTTYDLAGLPRQVEVTPKPINANGTTNHLVYVTNLTGQLHLIDDSSATEPEFTDSGALSTPTISPILTNDGFTKTEDWTLTYISSTNKYLVEGTISGEQEAMAEEGVLYVSDNREVSFTITSGPQTTTEGDKFTFSTDSGISTISIGTLPGGIVISADGERAYIANTGSDNISVVDSIKFEVIDTIR